MKALSRLVQALAVMVCIVSCREEPEDVYTPDFSRVVVVSGEEGWHQAAYLFDNEVCCSFTQDASMDDVLKFDVKLGNKAVVVAGAADSDLVFNETREGLPADCYSITLPESKGNAPVVGTGVFFLEHDESLQMKELQAINAAIRITSSNMPEGLSPSMSLIIPGEADTYWPFRDSLSSSHDAEIAAGDGLLTVFPQVIDADGKICLDILLEGQKKRFELSLPHIIGRGDEFTIKVDWKNADVFRTARVCYGYKSDDCTEIIADLRPVQDFKDRNKYYNVWIEDADGSWRSIETRSALCTNSDNHGRVWNDWDNARKLRDTMCVAIFEHPFDRPVKVRIEKRKTGFKTVEVRPSPYGISPDFSDGSFVEFTLDSYEKRKVSVEFDSDRYHNLFLIGTRPDYDKPDPKDPKVHYFAPGEWDVESLTLNKGETLYVDYGAVVYGKVEVKGSNCTIAGHGIISGEKLRHWGETYSNGAILVDVNWDKKYGFRNFTAKDVTLIDSPSWTLRIFNMSEVHIDGINMICWELNGDGIDICSCNDVEIQNCLLRNYDDCIALKCRFTAVPQSDTYDVDVHDCLIWNDFARGIVVGVEAGNRDYGKGHLHDILIHDCIILDNSGSLATDDIRAGFAIAQYASPDYSWGGGTANDIENITARDIIFDSIRDTGRNVFIRQDSQMSGTCAMRNILLENFTIYDKNSCRSPACLIMPDKHRIENLTIRNFVYKGNKLTNVDRSRFVISGSAENVDISFE